MKQEVLRSPAFRDLTEQLSSSIVSELSIYHQAYLIQERPLLETRSFHPPTSKEIPLLFHIRGDLNGMVLCCLNLDQKIIAEEQFHIFRSLYIESMNILLGKTLTNLEYNADKLVSLSAPKLVTATDPLKINLNNANSFACSYALVQQSQGFDCRINIFINK